MSAVLNTNTASLWAAKNLLGAQNRLAASVERLSSGLRINRARDDAAGLGVANSLTAQINGANQGMRNLNDAISMVQTAEGAISAASEMGQRILMLATQGANGTLGVTERKAIHKEMAELLDSIDSIGARTKFSGNPLLHVGINSLGTDVAYSMQISNTASDKINLTNAAFRNVGFRTDQTSEKVVVNVSGSVTIAAGGGDRKFIVGDGTASRTVTLQGAAAGGAARTFSAADIALALAGTAGTNITVVDTNDGATPPVATFTPRWTALRDGTSVTFTSASANTNVDNLTLNRVGTGSSVASISSYVDGSATDSAGQASDLKTKVSDLLTKLDTLATTDSDANRNAVTTAFQTIQTAANGYVVDLGTQRSFLGAYQNQMEYTLANITELSSNLSSARSRVIDTDYASETAALTRGQILQQAATAMLAQANQMPNVILTLLK